MAKHRTQVLLENWQYQYLKEKAREKRTTLSGVIRELVVAKSERRPRALKSDPLFGLIGLAKGPPTGIARQHDKHLYRKNWEKA